MTYESATTSLKVILSCRPIAMRLDQRLLKLDRGGLVINANIKDIKDIKQLEVPSCSERLS